MFRETAGRERPSRVGSGMGVLFPDFDFLMSRRFGRTQMAENRCRSEEVQHQTRCFVGTMSKAPEEHAGLVALASGLHVCERVGADQSPLHRSFEESAGVHNPLARCRRRQILGRVPGGRTYARHPYSWRWRRFAGTLRCWRRAKSGAGVCRSRSRTDLLWPRHTAHSHRCPLDFGTAALRPVSGRRVHP